MGMPINQMLSPPTTAICDVAPVLEKCQRYYPFIFEEPDEFSKDVTQAPVALLYDLDCWDANLQHCKHAFGETFLHTMAIKSNSLSKMIVRAHEQHGFGIECASIGEVLHALEHCKVPASHVVFDSPCKTKKEIMFGMENGISMNFDNIQEGTEAVRLWNLVNDGIVKHPNQKLGFRINPLVGAGTIAELSVSTASSKFGTPLTDTNGNKQALLDMYKANPFLNCVHVHVGSGGMGMKILTDGIRICVQFAKEINEFCGRKQIAVLDVGGGLPANYWSDEYAADNVPTFSEYAAHLRKEIPELFSGEFFVVTEFGQSLNAKAGMLVSKIQTIKPGLGGHPNTAVIHFGADCCVRQVYGNGHERRVECYPANASRRDPGTKEKYNIAGPLCFQGDFVKKEIEMRSDLQAGDFIILKDAGANTLSMFSRHCSRMCPPVYGYHWFNRDQGLVGEFEELKPRETMESLSNFWGRLENKNRVDPRQYYMT
jgi:diaminopimelate decarboxylase